MMQANSTFQVVRLKVQLCATPTLSALNTKSKNSAPCIGPSAFVSH